MRILHVLDHSAPTQSGYAFRSAAILREQQRLGWNTFHLTGIKHGRSAVPSESVDGLEYIRTAVPENWAARTPVFDQIQSVSALRRRLQEILPRIRPDLIQVHSPCLNALAALGLGKPVVYELRSSWEDAAVSSGVTTEGSLRYRLSRTLETYVLKRADAITTICEGLRKDVISRGVPSSRITVVPNSVDPDAFASTRTPSNAVRTRLGLGQSFVMGFIGSFFAWEGLTVLVNALPEILAVRPEARVLFVGGGIGEPALRSEVARLRLQSQVIFAGQAPHSQVNDYYDAIDLLVYPRLPMRLTEMVTPLKPLEAMALGKALVASDVGGHREMVTDGVTGLLFRAGDSAALAAAALKVMNDPELGRQLRSGGPRYVREQRTWANVVPRYAPVYERLLARRAA